MTDSLFPTSPPLKEILRQKLQELAAQGIYVGTSSWKYEGWLGQLYSPERYEFRGKLARNRFESGCLAEYAEVFKTVCVDAGYYQFPSERFLTGMVEQIPKDFRLSFKVTDQITLKHFPKQERHGARAGEANPHFLNAELFREAFLGPLAPYQAQTGILMFEFSRFSKRDFSRGRDFVEMLDRFLAQLPVGWSYGVELRNREFFHPEYFEILRRHGVAHVFNSWTAMPPIGEQMEEERAFTAEHFAARFLLKPGRSYAEAVKNFAPYTEVKEVQSPERAALKKLLQPVRKGFIYVNNRLEGNALRTIQSVLQ